MNKKLYYLFLDDVRVPRQVTWVPLPLVEWTIARNYKEFVDLIESRGLPRFVTFDHDLAEEHYRPSMYDGDGHYSNYYTDGTFKEKTGYECAKWLAEYCIANHLPYPDYQIHTMNPIGRKNIQSVIDSFNKYNQ